MKHRERVQAFHYILANLDLPCGKPFRHLLLKIAEVRSVIVKDDESLKAYAALQEGAHHLCGAISSHGRFAVVVLCDQPAERNTRARVEQGKHSLKDYSPTLSK